MTVANGGAVSAASITIAAASNSVGTLNIGGYGGSSAGTISTPTIAFGEGTGTINFNQANSTTISAVISGNGTVNQLGGGTTTLTGNNTYTGATTVSGGELVVAGAANSSTVSVNNGGILSGSGSIGGLIVNAGGTISPGNSPGTANVTGNAVWNPGGAYDWQVYNFTGVAGQDWDLLAITGSLNLSALSIGSAYTINLWSLSSIGPDVNGNALNFAPGVWTIATAAGGITGFTGTDQFVINTAPTITSAGFSNPLNGGTFSIEQIGNNLNLRFTSNAVPEPGTWAAAALLAGGAAFMRWRKRRIS